MITGIILASGFSKRMKRDKLLIEIQGEKIIERVIKAAKNANLDEILLVYRDEKIGKIGEAYGIKRIYNKNADLGQSESLKLGVKEAKGKSYMFFVGDQPFLTSDLINKLIEEYQKSDLPILVPYYNGNRGMPIIMSSIYREELLQIMGDKGARDMVNNNIHKVKKIHIQEEILGIDVDNEDDLKILEEKF